MANALLIAILGLASLLFYFQNPTHPFPSGKPSASATYLLATEAFRSGDFKSSREHFQRLLSSEPLTPDLIRHTFKYLVVLGDIKKAHDLTSTHFDSENSTSLMLILNTLYGFKANAFDTLSHLSLEGAPIDAHHVILQYLKILTAMALKEYETVDALLQNENGSLKDLFLVYKDVVQNNDQQYPIDLKRLLLQAESFSDVTLLLLRENLQEDDRTPIDHVLSERNPGLRHESLALTTPWTFESLRDMVMIEMIFGFISNANGISLFLAELFHWFAPEDAKNKLILAVALKEKGYNSHALTTLKSISDKSPLAPYKFLTLAETYLALNEEDQTLDLYKKLRYVYPNWTLPYLEAAKLMLNKNASSEALTLLNQGLQKTTEQTPDRWRFHFMLGTAYTQLSQGEKAEEALQKALTLDPENPYIMNFLAYSWVDKNVNLEKAIHLLHKATTLAPDVGAFWDSLGWAYFKNNKIDLGRMYVEKALILAPSDATANDHLGDIFQKLKLFNAAQHQWKKALDYDDDESDIDREKLKEKLEVSLTPHAYSKVEDKEQKKALTQSHTN